MTNYDIFMNNKRGRESFELIVKFIEVLVALMILVSVLLATFYMAIKLPSFWNNLNTNGLQQSMESYLAEILLIVVGLELVLMLILHTPKSLLDVMCFVIAREILVMGSEFYEIFIGVAALGVLFTIRKYLLIHSPREVKTVQES